MKQTSVCLKIVCNTQAPPKQPPVDGWAHTPNRMSALNSTVLTVLGGRLKSHPFFFDFFRMWSSYSRSATNMRISLNKLERLESIMAVCSDVVALVILATFAWQNYEINMAKKLLFLVHFGASYLPNFLRIAQFQTSQGRYVCF